MNPIGIVEYKGRDYYLMRRFTRFGIRAELAFLDNPTRTFTIDESLMGRIRSVDSLDRPEVETVAPW